METDVVEEVRGGVVEARHRVHAVVVDAAGTVLGAAGDPDWPCMLRSAAKPLQALPAVRDGVASVGQSLLAAANNVEAAENRTSDRFA